MLTSYRGELAGFPGDFLVGCLILNYFSYFYLVGKWHRIYLGGDLGTQFRVMWYYGDGVGETRSLVGSPHGERRRECKRAVPCAENRDGKQGSKYREAMYERDVEFGVLVIICLQALTFGMWD